MKSTVEAMSGIYAQLIGHDVGILPLVEACNKILDYVLENGFGGGSSNPLTPAQLEKIKKDVIDKIKTQVPIGVMLKDCELIGSKLKYTLSDNSNKELDLATLINKSVKNYVDTHKAELKGEQGVAGVDGKSAYELWKEKGNIGTEQDFLNSLKGAKGDTGNNGDAGVQGQKGNDGIGITNIEKIGDKLKITLSSGQIKEFTLPSGGSGTTGLTEEQVKTLINTFYKPQIDSKLERGSLDKNITADQLKKSIDKNTDKLTQTITDLKLVGDKLRYKENELSKEIDLSSYINPSTQDIETIVVNKGNTLYEGKDNAIVKNLVYDSSSKKITYKMNNENKEINLPNLQGKDGISLDFNWDGTKLGIKKSTETSYTYVDLKGSQGTQGLKGVGIKEISLVGNNLNIKLDTDEVKTITLPLLKGEQGNEGVKGKDGIGITNITSSGAELTVSLTDGSNKKFTIPTIKGDKGESGLDGAVGADGVGIKNITQQGKKINIELTNNTNKEFNIPEQELPNGNTILNKIIDEGQQNDFTKLKGKLDIKEPDLSSYLKIEDFNTKFLEEFEKNCVVLTKSEYEALPQKDPHKFYLIKKG